MLKSHLETEFVPLIPPLLDTTPPPEQQDRKNLSRAFSAFSVHHITQISKPDAGQAVVDDFDDFGIDAIYYLAPSETLYLVQSKLKESELFSQDEALAFCQGVRKIIRQDFSGFNQNVLNRQTEIEDAVENCSHIQLVIAHVGSGISHHAQTAVEELLAEESLIDERLAPQAINYDAAVVQQDLQGGFAYPRVDDAVRLANCTKVEEPRETYMGRVSLEDLIALHETYGKALYAKNIRTFLGHKTDVNTSIKSTLLTAPADFFYLNNGVTALCDTVDPKNTVAGKKKLVVEGFSVINGAQTIAASAAFKAENPGTNLSAAHVTLTLVTADADADFGKAVTRARNHQNPVSLANFAALDDEQERLRRDLAHLGLHYAVKAGETAGNDPSVIRIDEACRALALLQDDPRYIVWLKKEPARLLDTESDQYKALFHSGVTAYQLANAVILNRYLQDRMRTESGSAAGPERLTYKHGNYALAWVFAKRVRDCINAAALLSAEKLRTDLSAPFDEMRQLLWDKTNAHLTQSQCGPLATFRNQTHTLPLAEKILIEHYNLDTDTAIPHKRAQDDGDAGYAKPLFDYLVSKAPQVEGLMA